MVCSIFQFHQDYLNTIVQQFRQAAYEAIDVRALLKLRQLLTHVDPTVDLVISPYTTPPSSSSFTMHSTIKSDEEQISAKLIACRQLTLPQLSSPSVVRARRLQRIIRTWDQTWNSIKQAEWIAPSAASRRQDLQYVLRYFEDQKVEPAAPFLLYTVNETDEKGTNMADAIASAAFLEVC